jgi:hypothetical protein
MDRFWREAIFSSWRDTVSPQLLKMASHRNRSSVQLKKQELLSCSNNHFHELFEGLHFLPNEKNIIFYKCINTSINGKMFNISYQCVAKAVKLIM